MDSRMLDSERPSGKARERGGRRGKRRSRQQPQQEEFKATTWRIYLSWTEEEGKRRRPAAIRRLGAGCELGIYRLIELEETFGGGNACLSWKVEENLSTQALKALEMILCLWF